jgi:hypothetical protein
MGKCHCTNRDYWEYRVKGSAYVLATFSVDAEDALGFFVGSFKNVSSGVIEKIVGQCDGTKIWLLRTESKPIHYVGEFQGEDKIVNGKRHNFPALLAFDEILDDEEWEGTKVTT